MLTLKLAASSKRDAKHRRFLSENSGKIRLELGGFYLGDLGLVILRKKKANISSGDWN